MASQSLVGNVCMILHAHLPYVRHPEHSRFLEESWFYEAVAEVYIPLVRLLMGWTERKSPFRIALSLSPTLCAMLEDQLLMHRAEHYIRSRLELIEKESRRSSLCKTALPALYAQKKEWEESLNVLLELNRDLLIAFRNLETEGALELFTTSASHAILPLIPKSTGGVHAQIRLALRQHRRRFGKDPRGFWVPECAFTPDLISILLAEGVQWIVLDAHSRTKTPPALSPYALQPIRTEEGLIVFFRDLLSSDQVWNRDIGYPGHPAYRDFYRDLGFDAEFDWIEPYLTSPGLRGFTGVKLHRIGDRTHVKEYYDPISAERYATEHARHFLASRHAHFHLVTSGSSHIPPPIAVAPYDAELFGHWWHEGPSFLKAMNDQASIGNYPLQFETPSDYADAFGSLLRVESLQTGSWGEDGYFSTWINEANGWMYPMLRKAESAFQREVSLARRADRSKTKHLRIAGEQLLLAQSSDWPFLVRDRRDRISYAASRFEEHIAACHSLMSINPASPLSPKSPEVFPDLKLEDWDSSLDYT